MNKILVICASQRHGNSFKATNLLYDEFVALNKECEKVFLHNYNILPCSGCGVCEDKSYRCSIKDDADTLFNKIFTASNIIFISPIYFYALPANLKALVDRSQKFYHKPPKNNIKVHSILIAGRKKGDNLFVGASHSLKLFCNALGSKLESELNLLGLDEKDALNSDKKAMANIVAYAKKIS